MKKHIHKKGRTRIKYFILVLFLTLFSLIYINRIAILTSTFKFIMPHSIDYEVVKKIGIIEYTESFDFDVYFFNDPQKFHTINDSTLSYVILDKYIYLHEKSLGNSQSIENNITYYVLDYFQNKEHHYVNYLNIEDMPELAKIDSETGETWWYHDFTEMNKKDQKIFRDLLSREKEE